MRGAARDRNGRAEGDSGGAHQIRAEGAGRELVVKTAWCDMRLPPSVITLVDMILRGLHVRADMGESRNGIVAEKGLEARVRSIRALRRVMNERAAVRARTPWLHAVHVVVTASCATGLWTIRERRVTVSRRLCAMGWDGEGLPQWQYASHLIGTVVLGPRGVDRL